MWENCFVSIGSPLLDIVSYVDEDFLKKYNLESNDAIAAEECHKKLFEELSQRESSFQAGGSTTNTARVLQWMVPDKGTSCHIGCIGLDEEGLVLQQVLKDERVNFISEVVKHTPTGRCAVLLNKSHRSLVTDLGASKYLSEEFLDRKEILEVLNKAKYFYLSAFFFGVSVTTVRTISQTAMKLGKTLIFNIGAPFLCKKYQNEFLEIYPRVNVLFGNEEELKALAHILNVKGSRLEDLIVQVASYTKTYAQNRLVVITRGPSPILVAAGGRLSQYQVEAVKESEIKDSCCAGDSFAGGFLAQYIQGKDVDECVKGGISIAQKVIKRKGCNFSAVKYVL